MQCSNCDSKVETMSKGLVRGKSDTPGNTCPDCGEPLEQTAPHRLTKGI